MSQVGFSRFDHTGERKRPIDAPNVFHMKPIHLDPETRSRLIRQADRFHACPTDLLDMIVRAWLDKQEQEEREIHDAL